jgi:hypothetical protein
MTSDSQKFTIISGTPSAEELMVLNQVLAAHKRVEPDPIVKRSTWAKPQMRQPMPQGIKFGAGRNI